MVCTQTVPDATAVTYHRLRSLIAVERLAAGERLGTERALSERLQVTRSTLRLALSRLEDENLVKRLIGRGGGIFVSDGKIERELNWIVGVPTFLRQQGFRCATEVVHARLAVSGADEARVLEIAEGSPIFEVKRRRSANEVPLSVEVARLPAHLFPHLLERDLTGSLYEILVSKYNHVLERADEYIDARQVLADEAGLLEVDPGAVAFVFRRVVRDAQGTPVEHATDVFRADRIRMSSHAGGQAPNTRVADRARRPTIR